MATPRPIALTQAATNPTPGYAPEPVVLVGKLPGGAFTETALPAVPASFADLPAVKTYFDSLVTALKGSPYFS